MSVPSVTDGGITKKMRKDKRLSRSAINELDIAALADEIQTRVAEIVKSEEETGIEKTRYRTALLKIEKLLISKRVSGKTVTYFNLDDEDIDDIYEIIQQALYS